MEKYKSRKWILTISVIFLAVIGAFIPPIISMFLVKPITILTGTEFVSIISLVVGAYMGSNAYQNRGYYISQSNVTEYQTLDDEEKEA